jgi:hypothetical protein
MYAMEVYPIIGTGKSQKHTEIERKKKMKRTNQKKFHWLQVLQGCAIALLAILLIFQITCVAALADEQPAPEMQEAQAESASTADDAPRAEPIIVPQREDKAESSDAEPAEQPAADLTEPLAVDSAEQLAADSTEQHIPETSAQADTLEAAIADQGFAYVSLRDAQVYGKASMTARSRKGAISGIALATEYIADAAGRRVAIQVVFFTEEGLQKGFIAASDAQCLANEDALAQIGDVSAHYGADLPLQTVNFTPASRERHAPEATHVPTATPAPEADQDAARPSEAEATPAPTLAPDALNPQDGAAKTVAQEGFSYVRLSGARMYADSALTHMTGRVTGIALATARIAGDAGNGRPSALAVMFNGDSGLKTGYIPSADAEALAYQDALAALLGAAADQATELYPLPVADLAAGDEAELEETDSLPETEPEDGEAETAPVPSVAITWHYEGELVAGAEVRLKAELFDLPEDQIAGYRWMNNANGAYQDVPGATGATYSFRASEENTDCEWVVEVLLKQAEVA